VTRATPAAPLDPFVFVAATRYAIHRTFTSASETIAGQVEAHADLIRTEPGAAGAIRREIDDFLDSDPSEPPKMMGLGEWQAIRQRWARVQATLERTA
jgi:hypothetical protein